MKKLSIEEKAKAYDKFLEEIKSKFKTFQVIMYDKNDLEKFFPELAEPEDERIRKELIRVFSNREKYVVNQSFGDINVSDILAWLEKQAEKKTKYHDICDKCVRQPTCQSDCFLQQGEQKPDDKVEPRFKVGDIITPKDGGHEPWQIMQVDILDKKYRFKDGYVIHFSQEDDYELVKQKPWSEEDEKLLELSVENLTELKDRFGEGYGKVGDCINWFKSLKERYTWEPSDEQMKTLNEVLNFAANHESPHWNDYIFGTLNNLIRQLKKLKE